MARRRRLERSRLRHSGREAHLLCRAPRLQLDQEILSLRKHRQGARDPAVERAAACQLAQLHAGVGQRRQRAGADSSAQVLPVGRSRQGVRKDSHQVSRSHRPGHQGPRSVRQADRARRPAPDDRRRSRSCTRAKTCRCIASRFRRFSSSCPCRIRPRWRRRANRRSSSWG